MAFLETLLNQLSNLPDEDQPQAIADALAADPELDPAAVSAEVLAQFDALTEGDVPATEEQLKTLDVLARVADGVTKVIAARDERRARAAEIGETLRGKLGKKEPEKADGELPVEEPPADPEATSDMAVSDVELEAVAAGASSPSKNVPALRPKVPLAEMKSTPPATQNTGVFESFNLIAAADIPGFSTGQALDGLADFGRAWEQRVAPLVSAARSGSVERGRRFNVANIQRKLPDEFVVTDNKSAEDVLNFAQSERRLEGGSLTAAAGWCAPSLTLYDLCPVDISSDGMISLPQVQVQRGGLRYPPAFDWASIWCDTGFYLTEDEVESGVEKTCIEVPCDPNMIECRADVAGVCLRTPILLEKGWPERVANFTQGALAIHAHELNARKLAKMEELSTAITFPTPATPDPTAAIADPHGPGALESVLSMLELQVHYTRYRERLAWGTTLEMVAPYWLRGILKSDLRKKLGIGDRWSVTDATLDAYLRSISVEPQWVYDWQDAYSCPDTGRDTAFGGELPPTAWPTTVKIMLYKAGSFFQLTGDVITLDAVYDHASLIQNMYTSLFTEEAWQVCIRCGTSYVLELDICGNGLSGGIQSTTCEAPAPTP